MTAIRAGLVAFAKAALFRAVAFPALCGLVWWRGSYSSYESETPAWILCGLFTLVLIGACEVIVTPFLDGLFAWLRARREDRQ
ncbi:hypothetical protein [Salipiger marinus]|uniref:hypothetical protein n=1 Tax=Salipiger marinus TaxID=555512 RepID=UPI004058A602